MGLDEYTNLDFYKNLDEYSNKYIEDILRPYWFATLFVIGSNWITQWKLKLQKLHLKKSAFI